MKTLLLAPTESGVGLTTICLGLLHALDQKGLRVAFCKPFGHLKEDGGDRSVQLIQHYTGLNPPAPLPCTRAAQLLSANQADLLMEEVISLRQHTLASLTYKPDVLILEGVNTSADDPVLAQLNALMARSLDAQVILVTTPHAQSITELNQRLESSATHFGGVGDRRVVGCILNMINAPLDRHGHIRPDIDNPSFNTALSWSQIQTQLPILQRKDFHLAGAIPWDADLTAPRTWDVAQFLGATILAAGEIKLRRVLHVTIATQRVGNLLQELQPGTLVITTGDREDVVVAAALAQLNGVSLAGVLFTQPAELRQDALAFCRHAIDKGLPLLQVPQDSYQMINLLPGFDNKVPVDDDIRIRHVMETVAQNLDKLWLANLLASKRELRLSPAAFRYSLVQRARASHKTIVLPEGDEPRTIKAAVTCFHRGIARCQLLGNPDTIRQVAAANAIALPPEMELIDPVPLRETYLGLLVSLRKHKGLTEERALQELEDNVVLGTLMLHQSKVDGLVSGAVHTTVNTIRPALQLIRTKPDIKIVSSIFFMCLPEQVVIFGDCAINPDPNAEELADIAIASADSARAFGVTPRVAMISYSTMESGTGSDVDKVREATRIAQSKRPDLLIDGPLQYDAAMIPTVGASKAPGSKVAGNATVLIFPDLNTGNTTYKAVQRSAQVVSIGPMLQELKKPVNDLSR
ncbi:MAG: phosphate acetyltransferase, partial [Gammaproteobacteria bacterium]|nr:phosphate acetyltransferase [Gammaproteobacteria bacterium]